MWNNSVYGYYRTRKFTDIWTTAADFLKDYKAAAIPQVLSDEDATTLYYLLYARYGNSSIANAISFASGSFCFNNSSLKSCNVGGTP